MASSSPPPLVPIHGSDSIYYREKNNSTENKPIELHFDEFFKSESRHDCFKITNNSSSNGEYGHQEQSSTYHYKPPCHTRPHQLKTQSQIEINKSTPCQSTRPNPPGSNSFPGADIPADVLFHHDPPKLDKTFSRQEIVSDTDCYWYKKNLESLNTIEFLRKEMTELRTKLTAYENHRGNTGEKKTLDERRKFERKNPSFKCETCHKAYKTERGLESHRNSTHGLNWMNCQLEIFRKTHQQRPHNDVFDGNPSISSRRKGAEYPGSDRSLLSPRDSYVLFPRDATQQPSVTLVFLCDI